MNFDINDPEAHPPAPTPTPDPPPGVAGVMTILVMILVVVAAWAAYDVITRNADSDTTTINRARSIISEELRRM